MVYHLYLISGRYCIYLPRRMQRDKGSSPIRYIMAKKTHKIALRPTKAQRHWFSSQCGYARVAYNYAVSQHRADDSLSWKQINSRFNAIKYKDYNWTREQDQRAALFGIKHLGEAITRHNKGQNDKPKFKKRGYRDSYSTDPNTTEIEGKRIRLPKIGWVKMFEALRFAGEIICVTISRTAHRWFVSITVETGTPNNPRDTRGYPVVGIDVGINTLATLSDGTKYDNLRPLKRYERKIKRANRSLSKKQFLSNNWKKAKQKLARLHYRVACIREDAHHKASTEIVNNASVICVETLKVTNLLKNRKLAKALSDTALGGFLSKLERKAEKFSIHIEKADQFYASSKTCSNCGHKKKDLTLSERTYQCSVCQYQEDRDINAAINLRNLAAGHAESINACG